MWIRSVIKKKEKEVEETKNKLENLSDSMKRSFFSVISMLNNSIATAVRLFLFL